MLSVEGQRYELPCKRSNQKKPSTLDCRRHTVLNRTLGHCPQQFLLPNFCQLRITGSEFVAPGEAILEGRTANMLFRLLTVLFGEISEPGTILGWNLCKNSCVSPKLCFGALPSAQTIKFQGFCSILTLFHTNHPIWNKGWCNSVPAGETTSHIWAPRDSMKVNSKELFLSWCNVSSRSASESAPRLSAGRGQLHVILGRRHRCRLSSFSWDVKEGQENKLKHIIHMSFMQF